MQSSATANAAIRAMPYEEKYAALTPQARALATDLSAKAERVRRAVAMPGSTTAGIGLAAQTLDEMAAVIRLLKRELGR